MNSFAWLVLVVALLHASCMWHIIFRLRATGTEKLLRLIGSVFPVGGPLSYWFWLFVVDRRR